MKPLHRTVMLHPSSLSMSSLPTMFVTHSKSRITMHLFSANTYTERRAQLLENLRSQNSNHDTSLILITGNTESPMNYRDNIYRFRQDSNFRYYFGINLPNLHAVIDSSTGQAIIFGNEYTMDDIIWVGEQVALRELSERVGIQDVRPISELHSYIAEASRQVLFTPPYRHDNMILLSTLLGESPLNIPNLVSVDLIKAVVAQRSIKTTEEIIQMEDAVNITRSMHLTAMQSTAPDFYEYEVVGAIHQSLHAAHAELAYPIIFSINGQTLHNHHHDNLMPSGALALNDSGAENAFGYAGDITRTFPVNGRFSNQQKEIYELVLKMEKDSIAACSAGTPYREIHLLSNKILLEGLKEIGILQGAVDDMLAAGVAGMFMPHGLGHMIGMDVHDMEDLGEQYVGYTPQIQRSTMLGLKSLRLAKPLENGFVITVEPGIYFIPQLIDKMRAEKQYMDFVQYDRLEQYRDFGGVRIEDDVHISENGPVVLGEYIPKEIKEIEELMS